MDMSSTEVWQWICIVANTITIYLLIWDNYRMKGCSWPPEVDWKGALSYVKSLRVVQVIRDFFHLTSRTGCSKGSSTGKQKKEKHRSISPGDVMKRGLDSSTALDSFPKESFKSERR